MSGAKPRGSSGREGDSDLLTLARVLIDRAPFGAALLDEDLRYILVNETLAGLHGVPRDEHRGRSVIDVLPRLSPDALERMRRVLETGEPITNQEEITGSERPEAR